MQNVYMCIIFNGVSFFLYCYVKFTQNDSRCKENNCYQEIYEQENKKYNPQFHIIIQSIETLVSASLCMLVTHWCK